MEITKELIEKKRAENPGCKLAKVALKAEDEKSVALEVLVKSPDRKIISEAENGRIRIRERRKKFMCATVC